MINEETLFISIGIHKHCYTFVICMKQLRFSLKPHHPTLLKSLPLMKIFIDIQGLCMVTMCMFLRIAAPIVICDMMIG